MRITFDSEREDIENLRAILNIINRAISINRSEDFDSVDSDSTERGNKADSPCIKTAHEPQQMAKASEEHVAGGTDSDITDSNASRGDKKSEDIRESLSNVRSELEVAKSLLGRAQIHQENISAAGNSTAGVSAGIYSEKSIEKPKENIEKSGTTEISGTKGESGIIIGLKEEAKEAQRPAPRSKLPSVDLGALARSDKGVSTLQNRLQGTMNNMPSGATSASNSMKAQAEFQRQQSQRPAQKNSYANDQTNKDKIKNLVINMRRANSGNPIKMNDVIDRAGSMGLSETEIRTHVYDLKNRGEI